MIAAYRGPASADREEILVARADLADAARRRQLNARNHLLGDRRPEIYAKPGLAPQGLAPQGVGTRR